MPNVGRVLLDPAALVALCLVLGSVGISAQASASASLAGDVVDAHGAPAPHGVVILFPADPAKWSAASRVVRLIRPDGEGKFLATGLQPDTYLVIAREAVEGELDDPRFLQHLSLAAVSLTLPEGTTAGVSLKIED